MSEDIIPTVAVVVFHEGKVVLVKHSESAGHLTGIYGLPGGHVDPGESEKQAAVKELFEEAGLSTTEEELGEFPGNSFVAEFQVKTGQKKFSWKVFICNSFNGELKASIEGVPEWIPLNEMEKIQLLPNVKEAVEAAMTTIRLEREGRKPL